MKSETFFYLAFPKMYSISLNIVYSNILIILFVIEQNIKLPGDFFPKLSINGS